MKIQDRLALILTLFAWLVTAVVVGGIYIYNRQQTRENTRQRLLEIATLGVQRLDGDLHATLDDPAQMDSEGYRTFQGWLQQIRDSSPDLAYVYTWRYDENNNQLVFIVDAETDPEKASLLGDVYTEIDPDLLEQLATLQVVATDSQPTTDRWGTWISAYAPLRTSSGEVEAILGIDMSLERVLAYERLLLIYISFSLALAIPIILLISRWLAWRLAQPLVNLAIRAENIAEKVKTGRLDQAVTLAKNLQPEVDSRPGKSRHRSSTLEYIRLGEAFNTITSQMQKLVTSLDESAEQHKYELSKHTEYIQAAAELASILSNKLDILQLADQAVHQICQRFKLYYVGFFLLDEKGEWAILRAAANDPVAGDASQRLLARDFRLLIPSGMVGWCITHARPRVAQAARQDEDTDLPGTLSEAALPLRGRQGVIGALNLHSDKLNAFDESTITVLTIMADLLGIALENARLFQRSQTLLDTERTAAGKIGPGAWQQMTQARQDWGYRYEKLAGISGETTPVQSPVDEAFKQALQGQQPVQTSDGRLVLPIKVRQEVVGAVSFKRPQPVQSTASSPTQSSQPPWLADEIDILQEMMNNVGQALEGARLYQETQRRAAREQITSEITASMRASLDLETVLQTAVREIGEKLLGELGAVAARPGADAILQAPGSDLVVEVHLGEEA